MTNPTLQGQVPDLLYLLRRLLSNQFTFTAPEFRKELQKIVEDAALAAGQAPAGAANTKTHELLSTTVGLLMGYREGAARQPYKPDSVIDKTVAEAVEHLKGWPHPEPTPSPQAAQQAATKWDGKLPDSLQRCLNALRLKCPPAAVNGVEHEVRSTFEALHTTLATTKRMYGAARDRMEAMEAAQQAPTEAKSSEVQIAESLRAKGLTLVKTATEYEVLGLGEVMAQQAPAGATEMENLQRTAVGWQERALRAERNWVVCRRWAIAGGAPVEKLGDDPDQSFHAAPAATSTPASGGWISVDERI